MITVKIILEIIAKYALRLDSPDFTLAVDRNFGRIKGRLDTLREIKRVFISAASGAVAFQLPSGSGLDHDYAFVKTDSSGNAVTLTPVSGEFINAGASLVLAAQGSAALLTFDSTTSSWWSI